MHNLAGLMKPTNASHYHVPPILDLRMSHMEVRRMTDSVHRVLLPQNHTNISKPNATQIPIRLVLSCTEHEKWICTKSTMKQHTQEPPTSQLLPHPDRM